MILIEKMIKKINQILVRYWWNLFINIRLFESIIFGLKIFIKNLIRILWSLTICHLSFLFQKLGYHDIILFIYYTKFYINNIYNNLIFGIYVF